MSSAHFPDSWIGPGEFRFCTCGERLIPLDKVTCGFCISHARFEGDRVVIDYVAWARADAIHASLKAWREILADQRRLNGVQPLFWMEPR